MKKGIYIVALLFLSIACKPSNSTNEVSGETEYTVNPPMLVGGDEDEFGCKGSAGYSWSKIKQECLRIWEHGIQLNPLQKDAGTNYGAIVVMADDKSKGELFVNGEKESIWLAKFTEEKNPSLIVYSGREYKFFEHKGDWILEYKGKNIYSSAK